MQSPSAASAVWVGMETHLQRADHHVGIGTALGAVRKGIVLVLLHGFGERGRIVDAVLVDAFGHGLVGEEFGGEMHFGGLGVVLVGGERWKVEGWRGCRGWRSVQAG